MNEWTNWGFQLRILKTVIKLNGLDKDLKLVGKKIYFKIRLTEKQNLSPKFTN